MGDAEFQRKSIAKMRDAAADGRTVLFVSHQMQTVMNLCTSALFLQAGRLAYQGDVETAMRTTATRSRTTRSRSSRRPVVRAHGEMRADTVTMPKRPLRVGRPQVGDDLGADRPARDRQLLRLVPHHRRERRRRSRSATPGSSEPGSTPRSPHELTLTIDDLMLRPGRYSVDVFLCAAGVMDTVGGGRGLRDPPDPAVSRDGRRGRVHARHRAVGLQVRGELSRERVFDATVRTAPLANPTGAMRIESQASAAAARKRRAFR